MIILVLCLIENITRITRVLLLSQVCFYVVLLDISVADINISDYGIFFSLCITVLSFANRLLILLPYS